MVVPDGDGDCPVWPMGRSVGVNVLADGRQPGAAVVADGAHAMSGVRKRTLESRSHVRRNREVLPTGEAGYCNNSAPGAAHRISANPRSRKERRHEYLDEPR
jgi:hypothetical protein